VGGSAGFELTAIVSIRTSERSCSEGRGGAEGAQSSKKEGSGWSVRRSSLFKAGKLLGSAKPEQNLSCSLQVIHHHWHLEHPCFLPAELTPHICVGSDNGDSCGAWLLLCARQCGKLLFLSFLVILTHKTEDNSEHDLCLNAMVVAGLSRIQ